MNKMRNQVTMMGLLVSAATMWWVSGIMLTQASENVAYAFPCAGFAEILNPNSYEIEVPTGDEAKLDIYEKFEAEEKRMLSEVVMANINNIMNVRADASEDAAKVGYLYKDCGGTVIEQADGWTKIKSGGLQGWCSNEFLVFGDEAVEMAKDAGRWIVSAESEAVRVRKEPSEESETIAILANSEMVDFVEIVDRDWVSVEYDGATGYVGAKYIDVQFQIDSGETIEQVQDRNKIEEERKRIAAEAAAKAAAKAAEADRKKNRGKVSASADEVRLLAALIYTEAGNQSYEAMVGVGAVVMNRVKSPAYPNTIYSVIYASGQFTPALSGKVARIYEQGPNEKCMKAAQAAINGETTVGGATGFKLNKGQNKGIAIGAIRFF